MNSQSFIGKTIGKYKIKGVIGEGAFSVVCLAEEITPKTKDSKDNNISKEKKKKEGFFSKIKKGFIKGSNSKNYAAVKIIPKKKIKEKKLSKRLDQEIQIYQQMHHPNVVQLIDVQKDTTYYYIFLEFCPCGELYHLLFKKKKLTETEAAIFFKQLLIGLQYIHSLRVGHRDLKPENILIDQFGRIKISDFGLSKLIGNEDYGLAKTPCGSPCYVSPECISGRPYDPRKSDIWSCGVILYEMTTGELPWTKRTQTKLFQQIRKGEYTIPKDISDSCSDLICRLLTVDIKKRITIESALNHPFLKNVPGLCPNLDYKYVSLRKVDRFLRRDKDFEYHDMFNTIILKKPGFDSQPEMNFLRVRNCIESEDEKKQERDIISNLKIQKNYVNEKEDHKPKEEESSHNEKKKNKRKNIFKMKKDKKHKKNSKNNDQDLKSNNVKVEKDFNANKYIVVNQCDTSRLKLLKSEQIPIRIIY